MIEINEIIDDTFMDECVSKLNCADFYLFNTLETDEDCLMFYWKNGVVLICSVKNQDIVKTEPYTKGALKDYAFKLD